MYRFRPSRNAAAAHGEADIQIKNASPGNQQGMLKFSWNNSFFSIPPASQSQKGSFFLEHLAGLRGVAILLIIFFHLIPQYVPNGFLGVDVFLVITGYLLFLNLQRKGISVGNFLTKRILRIFPPLIVTVMMTLAAAVLLMHHTDVYTAANTGISTLLGYSNIELKKSLDGYFAEDASFHPLVHTWYSSVTIQIYLIFLAGCFIFRRVPRKITIIILSLIALTTLYFTYRYEIEQFFRSFDIILGKKRGPESHFKTLPRLWEPLAGMLVCFLPCTNNRTKATWLTVLGLILILIPACCPVAAFGRCALLVVIGTMLVLKYTSESGISGILKNKAFLWIGGISFSLYLVHIPVFVFFKEVIFFTSEPWHYVCMLGITVTLGLLLYHTVENRRFSFRVLFSSWLVVLMFGVGLLSTNGLKNYVHVESNDLLPQNHATWKPHTLAQTAEGYNNALLPHWQHLMYYIDRSLEKKNYPLLSPPFLQIGNSNIAPSFVLLGDSHANCIYMGLDNIFQNVDKSGIYVQMRVLPFTNLHFPPESYTREQAEAMFSWLKAHPELETVFLINRWTNRLISKNVAADWENKAVSLTPEILHKSMESFCARLKSIGKNVIVFTPTPEAAKGIPIRYVRWCLRYGKKPESEKISITKDDYQNYNKEVLAILNKLEQSGHCTLVHLGDNAFKSSSISTIYKNRPILWDDNHLTSDGATFIVEYSKKDIIKHVGGKIINPN